MPLEVSIFFSIHLPPGLKFIGFFGMGKKVPKKMAFFFCYPTQLKDFLPRWVGKFPRIFSAIFFEDVKF